MQGDTDQMQIDAQYERMVALADPVPIKSL